MVSQPTPAVALLSIHPRHASAIMRGEKRVEFRKRSFARPLGHVVIYATAPVQRIVGRFRVADCDVASPDQLWERYGSVGCIDRAFFNAYFGSRTAGVAITVGDTPVILDLPLAAVEQKVPPQSYAYLTPEASIAIGVPV